MVSCGQNNYTLAESTLLSLLCVGDDHSHQQHCLHLPPLPIKPASLITQREVLEVIQGDKSWCHFKSQHTNFVTATPVSPEDHIAPGPQKGGPVWAFCLISGLFAPVMVKFKKFIKETFLVEEKLDILK